MQVVMHAPRTATTPSAAGAHTEGMIGVERPQKEPSGLSDTERRQLIRKMRNREAAARSNHKRKIRHDKLKSELIDVRKKVITLRNREKYLKEENTRLRATTQQVKPQVLA